MFFSPKKYHIAVTEVCSFVFMKVILVYSEDTTKPTYTGSKGVVER
jgi:hypothetical protein